MRKLRSLLFIGIATAFMVASTAPASASTVLCSNNDYDVCRNAGYSDFDYRYHNVNHYWWADTGHNCTNYVAFRQATNGTATPPSNPGHAMSWWSNLNGVYPQNSVPVRGAIAWWSSTSRPSLGHVAYVENVSYGSGVYTITVSQDAADTGPFSWERITQGDSRWPDGFIYASDLGPRIGDFKGKGDGYTEQTVFRPSNGTWYYYDNGGATSQSFGLSGDIPVTGDYDGDGKSDYAVFRPSNSTWYYYSGGTASQAFGVSGDMPVPGDYNGDGKTDYAVFRPSNSTWYWFNGGGTVSQSFGVSGDIPAPGDYNGDGTTDYGVFRPSNGTWYWFDNGNAVSQQYGVSGDIPVPADYTGDGKTDYAVFRPSNSTWYVYPPGGSPTSQSFGVSGDIPVPGYYNSDGKVDYAVFRPSNSTWYYYNGGGAMSQSFGLSGDIPATSVLPIPVLQSLGLL